MEWGILRMNNLDFYDIVDSEIDTLLDKYSEEETLKNMKEINSRKSYGFLLWFLENNLKNEITQIDKWKSYIVDGEDDNSCDLIFSNKEKDEEVFYIIQAKWFSRKNCAESNGMTNIYKSCLTDFSMMLKHQKAESPNNKKFNDMYKKLQQHVDNNGRVRFLLVALCVTDKDFRIQELDEYIHSSLVDTQIFDLISMKNTYIDCNMRGYVTDNPLENIDPINGKITISIRQNGDLVVKPDNTFIFLLGADHVFELYEKFGTRLFLKNVRNPLTVSVNQRMEESASNEPGNFFGYNNGITAITKKVYPYYEKTSKKISVSGIQIINGAQTVKSIAEAYKNSSKKKRKEMAEKLIISMKLIVVDDPRLEQDIIQFTNTQTPIEPRDYHSNDIIQRDIYYDLLRNTDVIYERKRGEFEKIDRVANRIVTNEDMAQAYIAFCLQNPHLARTAPGTIFLSDANIYDEIFNDNLDYRDLYTAYGVYSFVDKKITEMKNTKKNNPVIDKQYKYLKDARYYITALIKLAYPDYDIVFNTEYEKTNTKHINKNEEVVDKGLMARSFLFNKLKNHTQGTLDKAFSVACEVLKKYSDISKSSNLYGSKNAYNIILEIYHNADADVDFVDDIEKDDLEEVEE